MSFAARRVQSTPRALIIAAAAFAAGLAGSAHGSPALDAAVQALDAGRPVEARALLMDVLAGQTELDRNETARAYQLLTRASADIASFPPAVVAVQGIELALDQGQLREADDLIRAEMRRLRASKAAPSGPLMDAVARLAAATAMAEPERLDAAAMQGVIVRRGEDASNEGERWDAGALQTGDPEFDALPPEEQDLILEARRFEAQSLFAEALSDFRERRLSTAQDKLERLLGEYQGFLSEQQVNEARQTLDEARVLSQGQRPGGQILGETVGQRELAKQQTLAEFNNELAQAERAIDTGDVDRARDLAFQARLTISNARGLFSESEFQNANTRVDNLLVQVDERGEALRAERQQQLERRIREQQAEQEDLRLADRDRKILEAVDRVRALQAELKYREALQVVDEILFLDPINPTGLLLRDVLQDQLIFQEYYELDVLAQKSFARQAVENQRAKVAPDSIVSYPEDWPQLSFQRYASAADDEPVENRRGLQVLEDMRVPVEFRDNTLSQVFSFLEAVTQLDIDVDWDALEEISIDEDTPVTLKLSEQPVRVVLDRVVEKISAAGFGERADWAVIDGVLTVSSDAAIRRNVTLEIYDIRDLIIEVPDYDEAPTLDLNTALQSGQGGGGQSPFQTQGEQDPERLPLQDRIDNIINIITENVDFEGWRENGGDTGFIQQLQGKGTLIVTNTPKNHRRIKQLLAKLRATQNLQVNVETRFLLVSQDFFEQIGFDLDVYFNADNNQVRAAQAGDPSVNAGDFFNFSSIETNTVGLQRQVGGGQQSFARDAAGNIILDENNQPVTITSLGSATINPESGFSPVSASQNTFGIANALAPSTGIAATILSGNPALGVAGQFLDDIQVDFLVQATQADRRNVTLTAPRLTFSNGQTSNIFVATQITFISDLQPVVSDSAVGFDPELEVVTEGVVMEVTGTVSADRRYVTLDVTTGVSEVERFGQEAVTAVAGGQLVSSASTQSFVQLPQVTVTNVSTTVTVPDQGTVMLGGQRIVSESEVESGVPVLSKLPILNRFFSNRIEVKEESTLLILIKPTILIQNEQEERSFPGLLDELGSSFGR